MRLIVDANVLVRCVQGRAAVRAAAVMAGGAALCVTQDNVEECLDVLMRVFGMDERTALARTAGVLRPFRILAPVEYDDFRAAADRRLRAGGESDWPALAAALAIDGDVWTDDVDFFGTGVAVWSSNNVLLAAQDGKALQ